MLKNNKPVLKLVSKLITNYKEQFFNYKKILELTKNQNDNIVDEDFEQLNHLVEQKQKLIQQIDRLQENITPCRDELASEFGISNDQEFISNLLKYDFAKKKELKEISSKLINIILAIEEVDDKNYELLKEKKKRLQDDKNKLSKGKKVFNSYNIGTKKEKEGKFIDDKG